MGRREVGRAALGPAGRRKQLPLVVAAGRHFSLALLTQLLRPCRCMENFVSICRLLPPVVTPRYRTASTNASFQLILGNFSYAAAEAACNDAGGHLASWSSQQEQYEVRPKRWNAG
jgi:hypothetical protein